MDVPFAQIGQLIGELGMVCPSDTNWDAVGSDLVDKDEVQTVSPDPVHPGASVQLLLCLPPCERNSNEQFRGTAEVASAAARPRGWVARHGDDLHPRD